MYAWTDSAAGAVGPVVAQIGVGDVEITSCGEGVVEIALWEELRRVGPEGWGVVDGPAILSENDRYARGKMGCLPPVYHDDGVFEDEVALIPIVFGGVVLHAEFIRRSGPEQFFDEGAGVW